MAPSFASLTGMRGISHVRTVVMLLASLVLAILLLGGGNSGNDQGSFLSATVYPLWHGVPFAVGAMATPSEGNVAEPAEPRTLEGDEAFVERLHLDFDDTAEAEEAAAIAAESPTAHLDGMSVEELKALLSEKKKGWVNLNNFKDRAALIEAIHRLEQEEAARVAFRAEVALAADWYAEKKAQLNVAYRGSQGNSEILRESTEPADDGDTEEGRLLHKLVVVYNEAQGYKSNFEKLRKELHESPTVNLPNFADFEIIGTEYPMSPKRVLISKVLQAVFVLVLGFSLLADQLYFVPEPVRNFLRGRRSLMISASLLLNVLSRSALQNSAFEIFLDDELIYSTLGAGGRLPTAELLSNLILKRTLLKDYYAATIASAV